MSGQRIAVLGLGAMGSRMARNLAGAGHVVTGWNRTPSVATELAASSTVTAAPDLAAAVEGADVVISMLTDDEASRSVWLDPERDVLAGLAPGTVVVESSTLTAEMVRELGEAVRGRGLELLEAPVVGSRPQADGGALLTLVGGDPAVLDRVRPVLEVNAGAIRHVGAIGAAATMKLAVNGLFGAQVAAYAEIVGLLRRSGADVAASIELLSGLPITSAGLQRILGLIADETYEPNFPIELVAKDFGYLGRLAAEVGAELPVTGAAGAVFAAGARTDDAALDIAGIARRYV
ncbi:MAG: NAD(P)-dependent oxidoreductase [Actinomycetota bacterium]